MLRSDTTLELRRERNFIGGLVSVNAYPLTAVKPSILGDWLTQLPSMWKSAPLSQAQAAEFTPRMHRCRFTAEPKIPLFIVI